MNPPIPPSRPLTLSLSKGSLLLTLGLGACVARADTAVPGGQGVVVSISAATLAEDCARPESDGKSNPEAKRAYRESDCRQTSVQLAVASGKGPANPLTVEKAQLFDGVSGKLIQNLTTRNPQIWNDAGRYAPWNAVVKPDQKLKVSFDMNAPDWSKMGGRGAAQGKTFRLELTVRVGGQVTKVGSTVRSAELMIETDVDT